MPDLDLAAFYFCTITDERTGKRRKTSYRMQPANALERFSDATPDLASKEVRSHVGGAGDLGGNSALRTSALPRPRGAARK